MSTPTPIVCFGEILWDMLPTGRRPAGAAFDLALQLHQLGQPVQLVSRVGDDELGRELLAFSARQGLENTLVQQSKTHLTGVVKTTVCPDEGVVCKILEPVAWDYIQYSAVLRMAVSESGMLVYSSLSARNSASRETLYRLLLDAPYKVFNVTLRAPHYSREVVKYLLQHADFVRLEQDELTEIMSWLGRPATPDTALAWLAGHFGLHAICVTQGACGALLWTNNELFQSAGKLPLVAGSSASGGAEFLASLLVEWRRPRAPAECLQRASAALAAQPPDPLARSVESPSSSLNPTAASQLRPLV